MIIVLNVTCENEHIKNLLEVNGINFDGHENRVTAEEYVTALLGNAGLKAERFEGDGWIWQGTAKGDPLAILHPSAVASEEITAGFEAYAAANDLELSGSETTISEAIERLVS